MSDLYKEALMDAKKLKEVAEIEAKNRIVEKVSPFISEMISKKIKNDLLREQNSSVFIEQEEEDASLDLGAGDLDSADTSLAAPEQTIDAQAPGGLDADLADASTEAPIAPGGADLMNVSVPDENGMITVDFNDLFAGGDEEAVATTEPIAEPTPETTPTSGDLVGTEPNTPPTEEPVALDTNEEDDGLGGDSLDATLQPEAISYKKFINQLNETSFKIDQVYFQENKSEIVKEALKTRLFGLIENLDSLKESGLITSKQAKINENKLEFFFLKLKEASEDNSYNITSEKNNTMKKTLKKMAAELFNEELDFAQDTANSGDTGVPTKKDATEHAKNQSGVSPEIGGSPSDIEAAQEETRLSEEMLPGTAGSVDEDNINDVDHGEKPWEDGEPRLKENTADANTDANDDVAEGAAGFGDTAEDPAVEFKIDSKEISEAIRNIRKENIRYKMRALKEAKEDDSWEDGKPEGGEDPSHKNLKEQAMEDEVVFDDEMDSVDVVDDEDGMDMEMSDDADLVLNIDLPDELEALLADFDASDVEVDVSVGSGDSDAGMDFDSDGEEEIILVDDESDDMPVVDDAVEESMYESRYRKARRLAVVSEGKARKAVKLLKNKEAQLNEMKNALQEQNLFTAKAVYLNKFLMREGLSKSAMRQIVEHLDRAKTLAEAKTIYNKIKLSLDKHVKTSGKLAGSPSKVTSPGSAKLTESVSRDTSNKDQFQVERWQKMAGISKKK